MLFADGMDLNHTQADARQCCHAGGGRVLVLMPYSFCNGSDFNLRSSPAADSTSKYISFSKSSLLSCVELVAVPVTVALAIAVAVAACLPRMVSRSGDRDRSG